jgi:hypothetical protein
VAEGSTGNGTFAASDPLAALNTLRDVATSLLPVVPTPLACSFADANSSDPERAAPICSVEVALLAANRLRFGQGAPSSLPSVTSEPWSSSLLLWGNPSCAASAAAESAAEAAIIVAVGDAAAGDYADWSLLLFLGLT